MSSQLGLMGLGTMGSALARNLASRGFHVSVWNRSPEKTEDFIRHFGESSFTPTRSYEDFVNSLKSPRKIILMVPAGNAVEEILSDLLPALDPGDTVMDGGNEHFRDTERFQELFKAKGVHLLGCGISGGEEGALKGPSMMPGGDPEAWESFRPFLEAIAAEDFAGKACVAYMGKGGAGHFVKMIHNGIEYAEMQMLAEIYDILKNLFRLSTDEIAAIFSDWNEGALNSYLIQASIDVLKQKEGELPLLDLISDEAGQKGTGVWTVEEALKLGVAAPSITEALFVRMLSNETHVRRPLHSKFHEEYPTPNQTVGNFTELTEKALMLLRLAHFEQGFSLLREGSAYYGFGIDLSEAARIWQGGCIIRSKMLAPLTLALKDPVDSLFLTSFAEPIFKESLPALRQLIAFVASLGFATPVISAGLQYIETLKRDRLPTTFIQGLRDRFGSHGYQRIDREGVFHSKWK